MDRSMTFLNSQTVNKENVVDRIQFINHLPECLFRLMYGHHS